MTKLTSACARKILTYSPNYPPPPANQTNVKRVINWYVAPSRCGVMIPPFLLSCFYGRRLMGSSKKIVNHPVEFTCHHNWGCFIWIQRELQYAKFSFQWDLPWDYDSWNICVMPHTSTQTSESMLLSSRWRPVIVSILFMLYNIFNSLHLNYQLQMFHKVITVNPIYYCTLGKFWRVLV